MDRPDLSSTFTKIALWKQTQYRRLVYLDADVVTLRAPDELFARDSTFAAVPDIGWPDCFNSGVLALSPNMGDYFALLALAQRGISFDGADQGLLNMHFRDWDRLSFAYNCTPSGNYQYVPAYKHFQSSIHAVHYIGHDKPWKAGRETKHTGVYDELVGRWWAVYDRHYRAPVRLDRLMDQTSTDREIEHSLYIGTSISVITEFPNSAAIRHRRSIDDRIWIFLYNTKRTIREAIGRHRTTSQRNSRSSRLSEEG